MAFVTTSLAALTRSSTTSVTTQTSSVSVMQESRTVGQQAPGTIEWIPNENVSTSDANITTSDDYTNSSFPNMPTRATEPAYPGSSSNSVNIGIAVGVAVAAVVLIVLVMVVFMTYRKSRRKKIYLAKSRGPSSASSTLQSQHGRASNGMYVSCSASHFVVLYKHSPPDRNFKC